MYLLVKLVAYRSTVEFSPVYGTDAEFKSDISYLKVKERK